MKLSLITAPLRQQVVRAPTAKGPIVNYVWDAEPFASLASRPQPNNCAGCQSWEPLDESGEASAGLCRRVAISPGRDAWLLTERGDWCADWE